MKTLILGMGNPILSDDGVGLHIARALEGRFAGTDVRTSALIGLGLLDIVADYDQVFVIDAIQDGKYPPGTVVKLDAGEGALHLFSSHGMHFFEILQLGKDAGIAVPEVAGIYGVEIGHECPFGEDLSPLLAQRQAGIVRQIGEDVSRRLKAQADIDALFDCHE